MSHSMDSSRVLLRQNGSPGLLHLLTARPGAALVVMLVLGYLLMSRNFAHLGVSPLFVGEVSLILLAVAYPRALSRLGLRSLTHAGPLSGLSWAFYVFAGFGILQTYWGMHQPGNVPRIALQNLVFHVYPLFFFFGAWIGMEHPGLLRKLVWWLAWAHGIYGVLYIAVLSPLGLGGTPLQPGVFGQPAGGGVALLGLIAMHFSLAKAWIPLLLNSFVLLGVQVRAEWLATVGSMAVWGWLTGRIGQITKIAAVVGGLLLVGAVIDFRIPAPMTRGGEVSARGVIGRAVAAVDQDLAAQITPRTAETFASTVSWRTAWWRSLWKMVHESPTRAMFGPGYGYPIWYHHPEESWDNPLRTPHNVWMHCLAYTGWLGVAVAGVFFLAHGRVLWQVYRATGEVFGFCLWVLVMLWAPFDCYLDTPYGAIPFYLLTGLAAAPLLASRPDDESNGATSPRHTDSGPSSHTRFHPPSDGGAT